MSKKPVVLCVLDGWGVAEPSPYNAISQAHTPNWDHLLETYPHSLLQASEEFVGLPKGQMGNSEVGHMSIGAGRVILQDLPRINQSITDGTFTTNTELEDLISALKASGGCCHLMGLFSPGGVHAHTDHLYALIEALSEQDIPIALHLFLDGRDTPPQSALTYLQDLQTRIQNHGNVHIATLGGRYYAMDRDNRWDRTEKAYQALAWGKGPQIENPEQALEAAYENGLSDEFLEPLVVKGYKGIQTGDAVLMYNFRADRVRQLLTTLTDKTFTSFPTKSLILSSLKGMTAYSAELDHHMHSLFPPALLSNTLGEVISNHGLSQLRLAETEKYAHVTFFLNGGREEPFDGEERLLIPSPKVATYDLKPEMAARPLTEALCQELEKGHHDFITVNYANGDMVGHTGDLKATIQAIETLDACLGTLSEAVLKQGGTLFITADHGNAESLHNPETNTKHTAHTCNPVPFVAVGQNLTFQKLHDGTLSDIAPTLLTMMGLAQPKDMTGRPLWAGESKTIERPS